MKLLTIAALSLSIISSASANPLNCVTNNPCGWSSPSNLGVCAPNKFTINDDIGTSTIIQLYKLYSENGKPVAKKSSTVALKVTSSGRSFSAVNENKKITLNLQVASYTDQANLKGDLSFGDYQFTVQCINKAAIGWE